MNLEKIKEKLKRLQESKEFWQPDWFKHEWKYFSQTRSGYLNDPDREGFYKQRDFLDKVENDLRPVEAAYAHCATKGERARLMRVIKHIKSGEPELEHWTNYFNDTKFK